MDRPAQLILLPILVGWLARGCGLSFGCVLFFQNTAAQDLKSYSDPLHPPGLTEEVVPKTPFYKIGSRLKEVEALIDEDRAVLDRLAPLEPARQFDAFGYHSDYLPEFDGVPDKPLWTMDFDGGIRSRRILGIVLVPAVDHRSPELGGYAFPKRFRISSVNANGKSGEVYVDWTTRDFPNPGSRPVVFKFPSQYAKDATQISRKSLRLEIFSGREEAGLEFFSLARVHLIRTDELQMLRHVWVSSSFESAPYWSAQYLGSPQHTLGMPLSELDGGSDDLAMALPRSKLDEPLVIRIDLDEDDQLGQLLLFPGRNPDGIDVPGYGFPGSFKVYRMTPAENGEGLKRRPIPWVNISKNPGNNMIRLNGKGREISALEIELNDFPVYQGQAMFALGEIQLFMRGRDLTSGRPVTLRRGGVVEPVDLGMLVDGRAGGRKILPMAGWLDQLAEGKPYEARLTLLEGERMQLVQRREQIRRRALIGLGIFLPVAIFGFALYMLRGRKLATARLRQQINSDLHDDVGSNLGSISLIAEQLQAADVNETVREDLQDLTLMAREGWASLREVVWVADGSSIRLPILCKKLMERANRVLAGKELIAEIPRDLPDQFVTLTFKRHLLMYFKEVVHNCARHSEAEHVRLSFRIVAGEFEVSLEDDGIGFDVSKVTAGLGLESLHNRALEMGGRLELLSEPEQGTTVILRVPMKSLLNKSDHSYKTSN